MVDDTIEEVVEVEQADIADVLGMAMRTGKLRGLPRPRGLPADGWYSTQVRKLATGDDALYLFYRWSEPGSSKGHAKSLGRLN